MISLNNSSLYYAVQKCMETADYKIIIATSKRSQNSYVYSKLVEIAKKFNFNVLSDKLINGNIHIIFENGSSIKCIIANDCARGYAAHLVIDDYEIDDNIRNCVLRPIEKLK